MAANRHAKNEGLQDFLVEWIRKHYQGKPILGYVVVDAAKVELAGDGRLTTGEVLAKELRHAQRRGRLSKTLIGRFVAYSPARAGVGSLPRAEKAPPGAATHGGLLDSLNVSDLTKPHYRRG